MDIKTKVIGVNIQIDRTIYAIVDIRGNIIAEDEFPTTDYPNVSDFLSVLCERIILLSEAHGGFECIRSVGIGAPSANFMTGGIENAPNLPWKGSVPLAAMMRDRLGLAVAVSNEVHMMALGEWVFGSAHGMKDFAVVMLGTTGVGCCVFSRGKAHLGNDGFAGELGHTCVEPDGRQCGCGKHGCLETYATDKGVIQTAMELMAATSAPTMLRDVPELNVPAIVACCEKGDQLAIEVFRKTGVVIGTALANLASILNPDAIILTDSLTKAGDWLLEPAIEALNQHVLRNINGRVRLLTSILDEHERNVLGASALAWDVKEYSLFK